MSAYNSVYLFASLITVRIGFEEILYTVDESVGLIRVLVAVLEGAEVLSSGVIETVRVQLQTAADTAFGICPYIACVLRI